MEILEFPEVQADIVLHLGPEPVGDLGGLPRLPLIPLDDVVGEGFEVELPMLAGIEEAETPGALGPVGEVVPEPLDFPVIEIGPGCRVLGDGGWFGRGRGFLALGDGVG